MGKSRAPGRAEGGLRDGKENAERRSSGIDDRQRFRNSREEEAGETIDGLFPPLVSRLASLGESLPHVHGIQVAIKGAGIDRLPVGAIAVGKLFIRPHEAVIVLRLQALR